MRQSRKKSRISLSFVKMHQLNPLVIQEFFNEGVIFRTKDHYGIHLSFQKCFIASRSGNVEQHGWGIHSLSDPKQLYGDFAYAAALRSDRDPLSFKPGQVVKRLSASIKDPERGVAYCASVNNNWTPGKTILRGSLH